MIIIKINNKFNGKKTVIKITKRMNLRGKVKKIKKSMDKWGESFLKRNNKKILFRKRNFIKN